jgi:signal transduction histidine kinase
MIQFDDAGDIDMLAHDLHNPLGTLVPTLDVIRTLSSDDEIQKMAHDAFIAAKRQQFLLENYFDYLRLQFPDSIELTLTKVDLAQLAEALAQQAHLMNARCQVTLQLPDVPFPTLNTDAYWFNRALEALLDTALKFCTAQDQLHLHLYQEAGWAGLQIADTGRPILPAYQERLFNLAGQFEARLKGSRTSVGLNLPFAQATLHHLGGQLRVVSQDSWTVFQALLPTQA